MASYERSGSEVLTIQEVANKFHIKTNKLRFYEEKGLLNPVRDEVSGYRLYSEEDVLRLQLILIYRALEVPVKTIADILKDDSHAQTMTHLYTQWQVVNNKVSQYRRLQDQIESLIDGHLDPSKDEDLKEQILDWTDEETIWQDKWNFDQWASTYDQSVIDNKGSLNIYGAYNELLEAVYIESKNHLPSKAVVLDLGVGTGNLGAKYISEKATVYGVDQSKEMLYQAKVKYPDLKLRLGEFTKLPFEDDAFDLVVSSYALHHLRDDEKLKAIKEIDRVLKTGGKVVIGDLMFESTASKGQLMANYTEKERAIIEDEYYTIIENFGQSLKSLGYGYRYKRIDKLLYVLSIRK